MDNAVLTLPELQGLSGSAIRLPRYRTRLLILGTGKLAKELAEVLIANRRHGYRVVGFLDRNPARVGESLNPGIIGAYDQLFEIVERHRIQTIAVCLEDRRGEMPVETLLDFKTLGLQVVDGHTLYEEATGRMSIDLVRPSAMIFSTGFRRRKVLMGLKRLLDCLASITGLIVLSPLWTVVALLIKLDSRGPVFYKQTRIGRMGLPYTLWKFRSMRLGAEENGVQWAVEDDPRITRLGRWLRKWRIDELPQLINVLKGEMSLVGPRPERPVFVNELRGTIPYYDLRHTVRPGITGWAQTGFRYGSSIEDAHVKLQYDLYYIKNLSLLLDSRIFLRTIRVVLIGAGAR
jgi:sugar transferase (PEP-CTERM system associated)